MTDGAVFAARKKRVTEQLGEAVFAAVGLMVRQYLEAPDVKFDGADFDAAVQEDRAETAEAGREENESFDMVRYQRLRAEAAKRGESGNRAGAETPVREMPVGETRAAETAHAAEPDRDGRAAAEAVRPMRRTAEKAEAPERDRRAERAEGDDPLRAAREVSGEIERDARRYDGNFYLY